MLAYTRFPNNFKNESHTADHVCRYAIQFISKYKPLDRTNKVRFVCGGSSLTSGQLILAFPDCLKVMSFVYIFNATVGLMQSMRRGTYL